MYSPFPLEQFPGLIKDRREQLGLTTTHVGAQVDVSAHSVWRWERGLGFPSLAAAARLARVLGINGEDLLNAVDQFEREMA